MKRNRKGHSITVLSVGLAVAACILTGCSNGKILSNQRSEVSVETLGSEKNISEIQFHMEYGNIEIISSSEGRKKFPDNEILVEKSIGENVPDVKLSVEQNVLYIEETEEPPQNMIENYTIYIYVPEKLNLDRVFVENQNGDLDVTGKLEIGNTSVDLNTGDIDFYGNIRVSSNAFLSTSVGAIDAEDIICGGSVSLVNNAGDINFFGDVQQNLTVQANKGSIDLSATVNGNMDLSTTVGTIDVEETSCSGTVTLTSNSGNICYSDDVYGNLYASTVSGDIDISGTAGGNLDLSVGTGYVSVNLDGDIGDYNYSLSSNMGNLYLNDEDNSYTFQKLLHKNNASRNTITIAVDTGDVFIEFE